MSSSKPDLLIIISFRAGLGDPRNYDNKNVLRVMKLTSQSLKVCCHLNLLKDSAPMRLGRLLPLDFDALSQVSTYNIVFSCVKDHKSERSLYCLFRIVTFKKNYNLKL